jgi:hypothetical protein
LALTNAGLMVSYNMLLFGPDSSPEDVECNLNFIQQHIAIPFNFSRIEIYAGTPLEQELLEQGKLRGSYLSWDYKIFDPRIEQLALWCRSLFARRRFEYRGLINQNITLGYHADIVGYFYPGPTAQVLKERIHKLCCAINSDTLSLLRELLLLAMDEKTPIGRREDALAGIRARVETSDRLLSKEAFSLARQLQLYAAISDWAKRLHLGNSQDVSGPIIERILGLSG